jgi:hypothetical protein
MDNPSVGMMTILNHKAESQSKDILTNALKLQNCNNRKPQDDQCKYVLRENWKRLRQMKQQETPLQFQTLPLSALQQC